MNRKQKLALNTIVSLVYQIIAMVCGFVLPRLILQAYGSEVNGLVNSITRFLGMIAFLEFGVGAVIQSNLYKPLADGDSYKVSLVLKSGEKYFRIIALALLVYIAVLLFLFPRNGFEWVYTAILILAISISSFAQYYFGIIDRLLLSADQRGYIQYFSQIGAILASTIISALMIRAGASIQAVKLVASIIYLFRPMLVRLYINRHYSIDRHVRITEEPIKQKWNGAAQHLMAVVLGETDTVVLTLFSSFSNVSIYSVYHMVVYGVDTLFLALTNGVHSLMGDLWARRESNELSFFFETVEFIIHVLTLWVFLCTAFLILPFVSIYTDGVTDINYYQPLFAVILTIAYAGHCLRLPYNMMILAAGHYKETQKCYIIAAVINVVFSVVAVAFWELNGVAFGTLVAMFYQTIWMAYYVYRKLLKRSMMMFIKQIGFDILVVALATVVCRGLDLGCGTYLSWIGRAFEVAGVVFVVCAGISLVFYRKQIRAALQFILRNKKLF